VARGEKRQENQDRDLSSPETGNAILVVTVSPEGVTATAVETKDEARILASKKSAAVVVEDVTNRT
jgi:hypothetical protein